MCQILEKQNFPHFPHFFYHSSHHRLLLPTNHVYNHQISHVYSQGFRLIALVYYMVNIPYEGQSSEVSQRPIFSQNSRFSIIYLSIKIPTDPAFLCTPATLKCPNLDWKHVLGYIKTVLVRICGRWI